MKNLLFGQILTLAAATALLPPASLRAQDSETPAASLQDEQAEGAAPVEEEIPVAAQPQSPEEVPPPEPVVPPPQPLPQPVGAVAVSGAPQPTTDSAAAEASDKISLDIKGMDVIDVIKMMAMRGSMNVVIGKNVAGRVTLFLKNVDIHDAFEILLLANDLAYDTKGGIVNVMTQRDYELTYGERFQDKKRARIIRLEYAKAPELAKALNQIKSNVGRVVVDEGSNTLVLIDSPAKTGEMEAFIRSADRKTDTKIFSLNYAKAEQINTKLQEAVTKGVGSVRIDERTNKVVITDYADKLGDIAAIVSAFDEKTLQVLIDAQIIEIRPSDKFEMGVNWDYWIRSHFQITSALPLGTGNRLIFGTPLSSPVSGAGDYKGIVDMLRTIGDAKVLSSPRIMALNNQEARILVGTKDAYVTSSTSQSGQTAVTSQSVNFVDVGIKLFVTPTVSRDGMVTMKIRPEISSAERVKILSSGQETEIPIVTTSEAETTIMIKDGVTVIIGGLRKDSRTKTVRKIPLLGDVPGLGFFFRSTSDEVTKTDLVILLTPHIITGESSVVENSRIQPKNGAVARMIDGEIITRPVAPAKE